MTFLRGLVASALLLPAMLVSAAQTDLADQPLFSSVSVPGNLLLSLSVEYPTANSIAYVSSYSAGVKYLGYFDPLKCYTYQYDANVDANNYFVPAAAANSSYQCASGKNYWSGAFLNWAAMQTIDPFRWALTGGYRVTDTPTLTVLEKAWASGQGGSGETPNRTVSNSNGNSTVAAITPFSWSSFSVRIYGAGNKLYFSSGGKNGGNLDSGTVNTYTSGSSQDSSKVWSVYVRVKVCDPSQLEANCTKYGSNYKPEGLMQQYSQRIRFGAFGYLNDSSIMRDGGVLRARMKFIGPTQPVPGKNPTTNTLAEWSATDGTMITNPDTADASATGVSNSGVMNYLNKFGSASKNYKTYDPVGELYYAGIRYYKNLGNVASYSSNTNATLIDGFPVIQTWDDPIQYSCQKNYILGIGDINTHADANLPGSTIRSSNEPALPSEVSSDTTVNVDSATNLVGQMEGISNLNKISPPCCNGNTYLMAGLAYDSHVRDIRPNDFKDSLGNKSKIQTISTYWLDVQEYQTYRYQNQFWLAAKYGGFSVPSNYNTSNTTALAQSLWNVSGNTDPNGKPMPDNYYLAGQADLMVNGLNSAFQNISNDIQAATTALSVSSANVSLTGNIGYSASYNSSTWSGDVVGSKLDFNATTGLPTQTKAWSAQAQLANQSSSSRLIATSNSVGTAQGVPFQLAKLSATNQSALSNSAVKNWNNQDFLNYLRGDRTNEGASGKAVYRQRSSLLGDIVGSKVDAVGPPIAVLSSATNPGYASFKSTYVNRKPVVYVGANDGMMHAFDGTIGTTTSGNELFAYVPSFLYQGPCTSGTCTPTVNGLASLGLAGTNFVHHAMVDATPQAFDIDLSRAGGAKPSSSSTSDWHTMLIGGLGKGGKGYYALDITDPTTITTETALAGKVMWEFGGPANAQQGTLGFTYGDPIVVKTKKYGWIVAVPSGYNNADGMGWLFILNPTTGALLESISTGVGSASSPAGLAYASAYVADYTDNTADSIYAGDLLGNVWRFDLTATSGAYPAPTQIAKLTDPSGNAQPVTTPPLIEIQPNSLKRYVMVGTGRLLGSTDIASSQTQSFYVIYDGVVQRFNSSTDLPSGVTFPIQRKDLNADPNLLKGIGSAPTSVMGYYVDLGQSSNGVAERVNVAPVSNFGTVSFAANLPNGDACNPSGTNRVFSLDIGTGISRVVNSLGVLQPYYTGGGLVVDLSYLNVNGSVRLEAGTDNSAINSVPLVPTVVQAIRQINWREVPTAD
ncbi:pilus assembly protein [Ralstonia wenshanensis]|uniref:pilus assembly protein n=1 Tax=Ralstonia wenshanensis TaxID=2842456 RepID=UPI002AAEF43C|nr:PilC/PilY family type IV pilus protein [Ralstonia wenshanensis]MDY7506775.1 PilC/PilY family type IV pilus protein [Ralstonia wenshanensis]